MRTTASDERSEHTDPTPDGSSGGRMRQAGAALAALGLVVAAAGPVLIVAADPAAAPFVLPFLLLALVGAALAWFFGTWSKVLAVVLGLLLTVAVVTDPAAGLGHPNSFFDFFPSALIFVGGVTAVVGGVLALAARRQPRPWIAGRERMAALVVAGIVGVLAVLSAIVTVTGGTALSADELAAADATVTVNEGGFDPADLALAPGRSARIAVINDGRIVHTFTSDELGVDQTLVPGDSVLLDVTVPPADAQVQYWCTPHSSQTDEGSYEGMVGQVTIRR